MLRLRSLPLALLLALGVAAPLPGCDRGLQKVEVPAAGVRLGYDLAAGQSYEGRVRRSETVTTPFGTLNRVLDYQVELTSLGKDPKRGDILVQARFTNVKIEWTLPPQAGLNISVDEFIRDAVSKVQGMVIRFNVGENGEVHYLPPIPSEVNDQLRLVIQAVLDSLDSAFIPLPDRALKAGESWEDKEKRGRKGKLGRYREGVLKTTFEGLYHMEGLDDTVAKLRIEDKGQETITTKEGSRANEWNGATDALFAVQGQYMVRRKGELRKFDPKEGTTFTKIQVEWRKLARKQVQGPTQVVEKQRITDPCDPDYVGPGACEPTPEGGAQDLVAPGEDVEKQRITDPCDPDYVGPGACDPDAAAKEGAGDGKSATTDVTDAPRPTHQGESGKIP